MNYGGPQVPRQKLFKTTQTLSFTRPPGITAKVLTAEINFTAEIGSQGLVFLCGNMDEFI